MIIVEEKCKFNSYVSREYYAVIKDEAFRCGITIKEHISNILISYVNSKRKEDSGQNEREINDDSDKV